MSENKIITPRKLSGFMELLPEKQVIFDYYMDKIKKVFLDNSFLPLDTPILEYSEILLAKSGGEVDKEVYRMQKGENDICMRYDLTVPLARFISMEKDKLTFPFKRFQIGKVFRGEKPQKGRFRELYQCDADIVGQDNLPLPADAECIRLIFEVFKAIEIEDILVQISNRNILFGLCEALGYQDKNSQILIVLDKIHKIGKENAFATLVDLGVKKEDAQKLIDITTLSGKFDVVLEKIEDICSNQIYQQGISELKELNTYLKAYNLDENKYQLDLSIIRGHNYYTGTVFETIMPSHSEFGAICAGGRYDNLTSYFSNSQMQGGGISVALTRLFDLLVKNALLTKNVKNNLKVEIIPLGNTISECLKMEAYLKENGIVCQTNYTSSSFKSKMKQANKIGVPYVIIIGEEEVEKQTFALKDMITGNQQMLSKVQICEQLTKI